MARNDEATSELRVGVVGLGNLGLPMAVAAARSGLDVAGFDTRDEPMAELRQQGGSTVSSVHGLADRDVIAIVVLDDGQVRDVVELLRADLADDAVIVVHSTVLPETVQELGRSLEHQGVALLDAPVSGGDVAAREGTLTVMAGGDARTIAAVRPYLDAVGGNVCELGPLGAGSAGKLANQMMTFMNQLGAIEAMRVAALYDVDEEMVVELARTSTSDSWVVRNWGFFDRIHDEYDRAGTPEKLRPWAKDLWDVMIVARENELSLPITAVAAQLSTVMFADRQARRGGA